MSVTIDGKSRAIVPGESPIDVCEFAGADATLELAALT
jgi:hypothetical protein